MTCRQSDQWTRRTEVTLDVQASCCRKIREKGGKHRKSEPGKVQRKEESREKEDELKKRVWREKTKTVTGRRGDDGGGEWDDKRAEGA